MCAATIVAQSQPVTTVTANPAAVTLRVYWGLSGSGLGLPMVPISDLDNDGYDEFVMFRGAPYGGYQLYHGDAVTPRLDTTTHLQNLGGLIAPVVGNFYGNGGRSIVLYNVELKGDKDWQRYFVNVFALDSGRIADTARAMWDSWPGTDPLVGLSDVAAADLDGDGDDELILFSATAYHDGGWRDNGEIWIYEGGPNFTLDTPTVVLINPQPHSRSNTADLEVADVDGDGHLDLLTRVDDDSGPGGYYRRVSIYFGNGKIPGAEEVPGQTFYLPTSQLQLADVDGDGAKDVLGYGVRIYLSTRGNARTRSFEPTAADVLLDYAEDDINVPTAPGHISSRRYESMNMDVHPPWGSSLLTFSGGANGPNATWDASHGIQPYKRMYQLGDLNGDGWPEFAIADPEASYVTIFAGGPYIPNDDPTVEVRRVESEGKADALSVWPNPTHDELNIAWRGDLRHWPRHFEVHDMLGRLVGRGTLQDGSPAAQWHCAGVASGAYVLSVYDGEGRPIATIPIRKL